jgi:hypothetical protein
MLHLEYKDILRISAVKPHLLYGGFDLLNGGFDLLNGSLSKLILF